jgi:transposase
MRKREQKKLARLERGKARRRKDSARHKAVVKHIAVLHEAVADRRHDWVEKITTRIAAHYDFVAIEQLPVRNMLRRAKPKSDPDNPGQFLPNGARAKSGLNLSWGACRSVHHVNGGSQFPCGRQRVLGFVMDVSDVRFAMCTSCLGKYK